MEKIKNIKYRNPGATINNQLKKDRKWQTRADDKPMKR